MNSATSGKWYAVYTKARWEKKVHQILTEKGIESYCPLNKVRRKWSDRYKTVEEPLFKSYVFVRISSAQQSNVRLTPGVTNFVYWLGKPAVIRNKEIEAIKRFLNEHENVLIEPAQVKVGQQIVIQSGPFMNKLGKVADVRNNKVVVCLTDLGVNLVVTYKGSIGSD
ncbi:UpxY family transcription antiterminator [Pseudoflavitalea sp. G-6-1-2]|uniref:UpxY family transcription antiterminator n=1 Tax=Pseudoflavitalea sp. G-6-1-2 TaxID=2728841 RepID=UPI00146C82D3|nr:UpxY family transcription antiterminator [Pseudoflavitalea sp. G-6-1-2]NML19619.1 UpxY family transcription antiterminator [Pseudoflavitalea sp. G-6-1-2]